MNTKSNIVSFLLLTIFICVLVTACQGDTGITDLADDGNLDQASSPNEDEPGEAAMQEQVVTDPEEVRTMLQELKEIRQNQWAANQGWWHGEKVLAHQTGSLHGAAGEWWFQFRDPQTCPQIMQIVYQEDGQVLETSILISESSLSAEEVAPASPNEENPVILVKVPDQSCPNVLGLTLDHVENILNTENRALESVEAVVQEGYLLITLRQKDDVIREVLTVTVDLNTGFLASQKNQIYINDEDKLEGAVEYRYTYETYDQLPDEIESQFNLALARYQ